MQLTHALEPVADWNVPAAQFAQAPADVDDAYVPAMHAWHNDDPNDGWKLPELHPVHELEPGAEYVPTAHVPDTVTRPATSQ